MQKNHAIASRSTLILYSSSPSRESLPLIQNSYSLIELQGFELTINTQQILSQTNAFKSKISKSNLHTGTRI